jgi:DNA-binding protein YbaB
MRTDMQAHIDTMLAEFFALRVRVDAMGAEIGAMTSTARSADRSVVATVGTHGQLVRLSIDPAIADRVDLVTLAASIVEASGLAAGRIRARINALTANLLPDRLGCLVGPDGTIDIGSLLPMPSDATPTPGGLR